MLEAFVNLYMRKATSCIKKPLFILVSGGPLPTPLSSVKVPL